MRISQKQSVIGALSDLHGKLKTTCLSGGIGQLYHYKIELPDIVRAVYVTNESEELPPDKVSVLISNRNFTVGNYFCFQFFDENVPRCQDIGCQTKFTYIGSPSLKNDLATLIARLKGDEPVYKYYVFINKTDEDFLTTKGIQMIGDEIPSIVEEPDETTTLPSGVTTTTSTTTSTTTTTIPRNHPPIISRPYPKDDTKKYLQYSDAHKL